jgi:hypothetical protein
MIESTQYHDDYETEFDADFGYAGRGGHPIETPEFPAEVLAEIEADRAIQSADDQHRNELAAAHAAVAPLIAGHQLRISRVVSIDDFAGRITMTCGWIAMIDMDHAAQGTSAREAADGALAAYREACTAARVA